MIKFLYLFKLSFVVLFSSTAQAELIKSQPICATQVHRALMEKSGAQNAQETYLISGIVEKSNFLEIGSSCELKFLINESSDGRGQLYVSEVRTNLMFPFGYYLTTSNDIHLCRANQTSGLQVERQDSGYRKTLTTKISFSSTQNGKLKISYSQKEGRFNLSGPELTCVF